MLFETKPGSRCLYNYRLCISFDLSSPPDRKYFDFSIESISHVPRVDTSLVGKLKGIPEAHLSSVANPMVKEKLDLYNPRKVFFTDGSLMDKKAGFGVFETESTTSFRLSEPCSVFVSEVSAILYVCRLLRDAPDGKYAICSDSLSTLNALKSIKLEHKCSSAIYEIKEISYSLRCKGVHLYFIWVPAHCGVVGNEMADAAAKDGATCRVEFERGIQDREYYPSIHAVAEETWQLSWSIGDLGRWCHSILPEVSFKPWFEGTNANRCFIRNMSRLISNHYALASHLYRINVVESNLCPCEKGYQDIDHVIWSCNMYDSHRSNLVTELAAAGKRINVPIRDILASKDIVFMTIVNRFILQASIKI